MSAWSDGYVSDINYTYGYYTELNPNRVVLPFLMAAWPRPRWRLRVNWVLGKACL